MHRPYPNADRALRQVARHHVPQPAPVSPVRIAMAEWAAAAIADAQEALRPFREMMETLQAQQCRPHALYDPKSGQFALLDG
ncbi:hypothetical protein [Streptomyces erythrochromogenes]|uniref:hypothetical protein n=1 Tax=Streptomyces erythrochromogenes TaxID=285574 RepID=UPI0022510BB9|nr:hypothetical protein [Streptomyces erythrochromogenes]MCX5584299.1 hypothetical protein [Streptomyces erythrochromogenes]